MTPTRRRKKNMAVKILARDDNALKNGSYFHVCTYAKKAMVVSIYVLGDFHGYGQTLPTGLREYTPTEARRIRDGR